MTETAAQHPQRAHAFLLQGKSVCTPAAQALSTNFNGAPNL